MVPLRSHSFRINSDLDHERNNLMSGTKGDFDRIDDAVLTYDTLDDVLEAAAFIIPSVANPTLLHGPYCFTCLYSD